MFEALLDCEKSTTKSRHTLAAILLSNLLPLSISYALRLETKEGRTCVMAAFCLIGAQNWNGMGWNRKACCLLALVLLLDVSLASWRRFREFRYAVLIP